MDVKGKLGVLEGMVGDIAVGDGIPHCEDGVLESFRNVARRIRLRLDAIDDRNEWRMRQG